jgi:hypothetical protein
MSHNSHTGTLFIMILTALSLPLTGFGSDSSNSSKARPPKIAGSCNNTASGFCNEFNGSSYKAAGVERACKGQGLIFLAGACPSEGLVGTCVVYKGKNTESRYRYYTTFPGFGIKPAGGVAAAAESQCTALKGEWNN